MPNYTLGDTRITLSPNELATHQANGSIALNSQRARPLWFDGRFLAARDLAREQDYFLQRQADLARSAGFGVLHGLWVQTSESFPGQPNADVVVIRSGQGITPAGELVLLPNDLTIRLSDIADEQNLEVQFNISSMPNAPARTRSGLYVLGLRPVEFTANPITSFPTSIQGTRTTHDGDIVEATAVTLLPYPDPVSMYDAAQRRAALARQIFLNGQATQVSASVLPLAMISIQRGVIEWVDPYLVRRDTGPDYSGLRFGLADRASQQAFLMQYDAQLQETVATRRASGLPAGFAAGNYFQLLPSAARFTLASITINNSIQDSSQVFSQIFFPQQMDIRLSIIPVDEIPALIEESMSLPPIDLTLPQDAYANLSVFALVPVTRDKFAALRNTLPVLAPNPALPQVISFRPPLDLLRLYRGGLTVAPPPPSANASWASVIADQTYGFYVRRRSSPTFVDFTTLPAA
jgi:hypothetical protein